MFAMYMRGAQNLRRDPDSMPSCHRHPVCPIRAKRLQQVRERVEHKGRKRATDSKATNITAPPYIANNIAFPPLGSKIAQTHSDIQL